ncbi:MAG: hypothetical protein LBQ68_02665 [Clostridiales bacterium]|jgi:hypothetical protein|nr:hypothetical protein [Clostridiales bacterium]
MNAERLQINFAEKTEKAEIIIREGAAVKELEPKPPIKTVVKGVIGTVAEYLSKRVSTGQFTQERSRLIVNRDDVTLKLIINEDDEYKIGFIEGRLEFHPKFKEFGINDSKLWTPRELGLFFKMNRAFFPDRKVNMQLVADLTNFIGTVNSRIEKSVSETGSKSDIFAQTVNSNLPAGFVLQIPIFKGMKPETLEVETFAKVDGRDVALVLISPGALQTLEEIRDSVIDEQLTLIREIAPNIAIIEE